MINSSPNCIQEYYIAYFDILGYKEFFKEHSDQAPDLLNSIHDAVQRIKSHIAVLNMSPILNGIGHMDIHSKIFSDNILLCMETSEERLEPVRLLAFLRTVADIQQGLVNEYGLFVRGGITKGEISFHEDYVFGQGIIDVVEMEEGAQYPRILIDNALVVYLQKTFLCSKEDLEKWLRIGGQITQEEHVELEEMDFCSKTALPVIYQQIFNSEVLRIIMMWPDEKWILCYLNMSTPLNALGEEFKNSILQMIKEVSKSDYQFFQQPAIDFDKLLRDHKVRVEEQLVRYGNNKDIATGEMKNAELREKILRKYIWVMAFHNCICDLYKKQEHKILTDCNCDARFLRMIIEVLDDDAESSITDRDYCKIDEQRLPEEHSKVTMLENCDVE